MRFTSQSSLALGLAAVGTAYPFATVQNRALSNDEKAQAAVDAFKLSWKGYYEHAFPHDTLRPVTNSYEDDRNEWGATAVDALSTAVILEQKEIVDQILDFIPTIDFSTTKKPNNTVSLFETNIRYLGGLLSGYDLLKGPAKNLVSDDDKVDALLEQAKSVADAISIGFDTPSGVPEGDLILNPEPRQIVTGKNGIAGIGTLVLEWVHLSDLTGDDKYGKLALKAEQYLIEPTGEPEAFPGLIGHTVSTETGEFLDSNGGWGGGTDSFYEYLIKMYLYDPEEFEQYKDRWILAADSTIKHLASHPTTRDDLTFLKVFDGPNQTVPHSGHLDSFAGGNFILGGVLLDEQKYIDFGVELAESYYGTYQGSPAGIGPEGFGWVDSTNPAGGSPPDDQADFYDEAGYWVTSPQYILRPETLESLYHAYRVTGDTKFQDYAWEAFETIQEQCKTGSAYSGLKDVKEADGGGHDDFMESFFLAETLKYVYLMFGPETPFDLKIDEPNEYVYNTEAHPFKIRG